MPKSQIRRLPKNVKKWLRETSRAPRGLQYRDALPSLINSHRRGSTLGLQREKMLSDIRRKSGIIEVELEHGSKKIGERWVDYTGSGKKLYPASDFLTRSSRPRDMSARPPQGKRKKR